MEKLRESVPKVKAAKPRWPKATRSLNLTGASAPVRRLVADWSSARVSKTTAARNAVKILRGYLGVSGSAVPSRYKGVIGAQDVLALSALAAQSGESILKAPEVGPDADGMFCKEYVPPYTCSIASEHFEMSWFPAAPGLDLSDGDGNGVPDMAEQTLDKLESAWTFYHDQLDMKAPDGMIYVWWSNPLGKNVNYRAASWPTRDIFLPATYEVAYLPVHELFHQFQWTYMPSMWTPVDLWDSTLNINWWMEATAEWATTQYALASPDGHTSTIPAEVPEARNLPEFLGTTGEQLTYGNFMMSNVFRQYGAVAVVEMFSEIFDRDFVHHTWESVEGHSTLDGFTQLDDALYQHYWGDMAFWTPILWSNLYTECDPAMAEWQSDVFATWCDKYVTNRGSPLIKGVAPAGSQGRPEHAASSARHGSTGFSLGGGGALFQDIAIPASAVGTDLHVLVSAADTSTLRAYVYSWDDTPGDQCTDPNTYDATGDPDAAGVLSASISVTSGCTNATIMLDDSSLADGQQDVTVSWSAYSSGAIITNGVVTLGVNANGTLNEQTDGDGNQVALLDNQTGTEFYSYLWPDNYLLLDVGQEAVLGGVYWVGELPHQDVTVLDFWATSSQAESTVRVGDYQIVQHFHPSSNSHAYQLDVTVRTADNADPPSGTSLVYRRALVTPAAYDGTAPLASYVTYGHDSGVLGYTNVPRQAGLDDASGYLQPYDLADVGDWGTSQQGFGMDIPITAANSDITLYVGATDSPSSAASVVADLGVGTYGLATPPIDSTSTTYLVAH